MSDNADAYRSGSDELPPWPTNTGNVMWHVVEYQYVGCRAGNIFPDDKAEQHASVPGVLLVRAQLNRIDAAFPVRRYFYFHRICPRTACRPGFSRNKLLYSANVFVRCFERGPLWFVIINTKIECSQSGTGVQLYCVTLPDAIR